MRGNKNVLIINSGSTPIPATSGGAVQQVLFSVAVGLANKGWKVGILTSTTRQSIDETKKYKNINWFNITSDIKSGGINSIFQSMKVVKQALKGISPSDYNNILIFDPYLASAVYKWNPKAKIIWSAHNVRNKTRFLIKWWTRNVNYVISVSGFLQKELKKYTGNKTYEVIHNPLPNRWLEEFKGMERTPSTILFCGRIVPEKGLDILIKALENLPYELKKKVKLGVAGSTHFYGANESDYSLKVKENIKISNINYEWLGYVNNKDLPELYSRYDVLVIPSNWAEPATLVAGEGQARGCKVVATKAGGLPEMVAPVWRDLLAEPGDVETLTKSLEKVIRISEDKADQYRQSATQWITQEIGLEKVIEKWERILQTD